MYRSSSSNYRILTDILDRSSEKKDLMVSLSGLTEENFAKITPFLNVLKNSQYNYDLYVGLVSQELDQVSQSISLQTINLFSICSNHLLISLSSDENIRLLHTKIAQTKNKDYFYLLTISMEDEQFDRDLSCLFQDLNGLKRTIHIMDQRPDLASMGSRSQLSYLDNYGSSSLKSFFQFRENEDPYKKKREVIRDFIAEYYDRDIDDTLHLLEHHIKANNYFTVFQSFDLPRGEPSIGEDNSIRKELQEWLKDGEELPQSTHLIELIYRQEGIPQFVQGPSITKFSFWNQFVQTVFTPTIHSTPNKTHDHDIASNPNPNSTANANATEDLLNRSLAIFAYQNRYWVGGIYKAEALQPVTLVACHFKSGQKEINQIVKQYSLESLCRLSRKVIAIYSVEEDSVEEDLKWFDRLKEEYSFESIRDEFNKGFDLSKWLIALKREKIEENLFNWVWLTNDSWFSCRSISDWLEYYGKRIDLGLIGLTDNLEHNYHLQSYSWLLSSRFVKLLINWNQTNGQQDYETTITRNEVGFCNYLLSRGVRLASYYNTMSYSPYNLFTDRKKLFQVVEQIHFPLVKLRFFTILLSKEVVNYFQTNRKGSSFLEWYAKTVESSTGRQQEINRETWRHSQIELPIELSRKNRDISKTPSYKRIYRIDLQYLQLLDRTFHLAWFKNLEGISI